jgi:hypothetical protein
LSDNFPESKPPKYFNFFFIKLDFSHP